VTSTLVMAGQSRSKNGVASLAYVPAIHVLLRGTIVRKTWMPAFAGMTWFIYGAGTGFVAETSSSFQLAAGVLARSRLPARK